MAQDVRYQICDAHVVLEDLRKLHCAHATDRDAQSGRFPYSSAGGAMQMCPLRPTGVPAEVYGAWAETEAGRFKKPADSRSRPIQEARSPHNKGWDKKCGPKSLV